MAQNLNCAQFLAIQTKFGQHFLHISICPCRLFRVPCDGRVHWCDYELLWETLWKLEVLLVIYHWLGVSGAHLLFR